MSWLHFEWRLLRSDGNSLPRPDAIIVSSLSILTILNGLWIRRRYRTRLIFEIRDIWPLTLVEEGGFGDATRSCVPSAPSSALATVART